MVQCSIYNKKTKRGRNSQHVRAKFDLGGGTTKIADVNIRSIQAALEDESGPEKSNLYLLLWLKSRWFQILQLMME